jgi:hypothetical protein
MDPDLEIALRDLGPRMAYPTAGPDLALAVGSRIRSAEPRTTANVLRPVFRPAWQPAWQRAAVALVAMVALLSGVLLVSPTARRAVATWLGLRGVKLEVVPTLPPATSRPLGEGLSLGRLVSLGEARREVPYRILVPTLPVLGSPDEVYLDPRINEGIVSLVYRARPGYPPATETGVGVLVTEFRAEVDEEFIEKKLIGTATSIESVEVHGTRGFWLEGRPHVLYFLDPDGIPLRETVRLAGNVLIWERGDLTLRIEGDIGKEEAIRIAESMG